MGIYKMITKGKCFDLLTNSFNKLLESFRDFSSAGVPVSVAKIPAACEKNLWYPG